MKITVIGAGIMGSGIAHASAVAGFDTSLYDVSKEVLEKASQLIEVFLDTGVKRGKLDTEAKAAALSRLELGQDLADSADGAGLVIEAVPEKIELKCKLFGNLDELTSEKTVLATNTSSLSVTEIAAATSRPERVIGMHFFNPGSENEAGGDHPGTRHER